jgi:uncharacterized protein
MLRTIALYLCLLALAADPRAQASSHADAPTLYVFLFEPGPAWVAGKPMEKQDLREHAAYHARLVKENKAFAAGGFVGQAGGMALIRAGDLAEANAVRDADPAIKSGVFTVRIVPWSPRFVSPAPLVEEAS